MELRRLRYFLAAAEEQSFRRVAERFNIAQSALSRQIATFEEELGVDFRRGSIVSINPPPERTAHGG